MAKVSIDYINIDINLFCFSVKIDCAIETGYLILVQEFLKCENLTSIGTGNELLSKIFML